MSTTILDLNKYPDWFATASNVMGSLEFGRDRLKELLKDLTPEELSTRPEGFPNDIATLAVHIPAIEVRFCHLIQGKELPADLAAEYLLDQPMNPLPRPSGETVASLESKLDKAMGYVRDMLSSLTAEDLDRVVPARPGFEYTVRWMVGLLPMHQSQHFGQMQMLKRLIRGQL